MEIQSNAAEQVVVRFTVNEGDHSYSDALYFTPAEYAALEPGHLEAMQQQRFAAWKQVVTAPPREVTVEERQAQIGALTEQQIATQGQILALADSDRAREILTAQAAIIAEQLVTLGDE